MTIVAAEQLWDTFETLRDHLFNQFETPPFDPETGVPPEALELEIEDYLASHPDLPRVLQKAHIFRIVVTRGQIGILRAATYHAMVATLSSWYRYRAQEDGMIRASSPSRLDEMTALLHRFAVLRSEQRAARHRRMDSFLTTHKGARPMLQSVLFTPSQIPVHAEPIRVDPS